MIGTLDPTVFIAISDIDQSRRFYCDVLGLAEVSENPFALILTSGTISVRLTPVPDHTPAGHTVVGWSVSDVGSTAEALRKRGVEPLRYGFLDQDEVGIWRSPDGVEVLWFADPDGNVLSVQSA